MNVLPYCTETEHSQQEVLTLTQMSSPVPTGTDATQHPDTTLRPGNASKRADNSHKQLDRTPPPTRLHLSLLSAFLRRITRLTPRAPATQQQRQPASQLEARARSRDVPPPQLPTSLIMVLIPSTPKPEHYHTCNLPDLHWPMALFIRLKSIRNMIWNVTCIFMPLLCINLKYLESQ